MGVENSSGERNNMTTVKSRPYDTPFIKIKVHDGEYPCLLDSGATISVCSQQAFFELKRKFPKLLTLPTCGIYCLTAVGAKRQKVKGQVVTYPSE